MRARWRVEAAYALAASAGVGAVTWGYFSWLHVTSTTTVALSYLLVVLFVAASARAWIAIATSAVAALAFDFFFIPPVGTFNIDDPQDWIAFSAFITVSLVASRLSSLARAREREVARLEMAERSVAIKSALLASLAHDLRTPLTAIGMAVDNLSQTRLTEIQRAGQVEVAQVGLDRLTRLFQNLLEMTRIDAGEITLSRRWVHSSEIVQAARSHAEYALRRHNVETVDRSDNRAVLVDPRLVTNALAHLLENAAQYSPEGSLIAVTHEVTSEGVLLSVQDEGPGIAASDLPHLFERFYRGGHAHRHASGTGMGLAIARGLLAAEGGRVWADEFVERGARFSIFIPAPTRVAIGD